LKLSIVDCLSFGWRDVILILSRAPARGQPNKGSFRATEGNRTTTAQSAFCAVTIAQSVDNKWVSASSASPAENSASWSQSAKTSSRCDALAESEIGCMSSPARMGESPIVGDLGLSRQYHPDRAWLQREPGRAGAGCSASRSYETCLVFHIRCGPAVGINSR